MIVGMTADPTITVSAVVIRDADGLVLTVRKRGTDRFMHPGGKAEPGESPVRTAVREVAEELGLQLPAERLRSLGRQVTATANEPGHRLVADVFEVPWPVRDDQVLARAEIAELRWVDLDSLAGLDEDDCAPWAPLLVRTARLGRVQRRP